ncbi:zinc ribbon domain-containing protein [Actinoallomurus bryophytorum]|uniref:zinc ribbon domain-containing protein n=1 Tax=Actinoallomurus bryophytorum TaxID=1490222 RepID=UPI001C8A6998|nr:zinc ribbon domain-containing protein [Actinoallomurus bryophytorum]
MAVSAALSTGEVLSAPGLRETEGKRLLRLRLRLRRRPARARRGSNRKQRVKAAIGRSKARESDRRGTIDAPGRNVRAKAGPNRSVHAAGRGLLVARPRDKAPGRVEKVDPAFTSQICHACGYCDPGNRESQAVFRCRARARADHADVNAAKNIAAGRAVTARGGRPLGGPVNREPQPVFSSA